MIHSTWDNWFVRNVVENARVNGLSAWYLGCNGLIVRTPETTLYIDPYFADGDPPNIIRMIPVPMDPSDATDCDAVFVTHEHIDHMHPPSFLPLVGECGATVYAPEAAYEKPDYNGDFAISSDKRTKVTSGETYEVGDLTVHVRAANDPDAIEPVSYVIEHDSGTLFHGGDSRPADSFHDVGEAFDIDIGYLALGSVGRIRYPERDATEVTRWYMDENQIIEATNQLQLTRLAPTHYDMWRGVGTDPKGLIEHARSFEYPRSIEPIQIGDRLDARKAGILSDTSLDPKQGY